MSVLPLFLGRLKGRRAAGAEAEPPATTRQVFQELNLGLHRRITYLSALDEGSPSTGCPAVLSACFYSITTGERGSSLVKPLQKTLVCAAQRSFCSLHTTQGQPR